MEHRLPQVELESRWELDKERPFYERGIDETMSVDHIWYIRGTRKFESHCPQWRLKYSMERIIAEIADGFRRRAAL